MHLEEFAEGTTLLHRTDPRVKFIFAGPFLVLAAVMPGIRAPLFALMVGLGLSVLGRLEPGKLLQRLLVVNVFVLLLWVFVPFSMPGIEVFGLGPLAATREGLLLALSITLKSNAIVIATIAVFGTTGAMSLAHALVHLKVPRKIVYLFFFFYRYVSVLHEEYTRLRSAMRVRGFRAGPDPHTYRTLANLIGMLIVRSHERSERIYEAMLCRGFRGHFPVMGHFHLHASDIWVAAALAAVSVGMLLLA